MTVKSLNVLGVVLALVFSEQMLCALCTIKQAVIEWYWFFAFECNRVN